MQASISRNDNREPATYNFQILMIRSNNEWFVDPNSISSSQIVQPQASQPPLQTGAIAFPQGSAPLTGQSSQAVRSDTMLYYNQDGGEYYHADANCSSVGTKYKPLKAMFYYRDVSSEQFKNLKPCPVCGAPSR